MEGKLLLTEGTSMRLEDKGNTLVWFSNRGNEPTIARRVLRKTCPQSSKTTTLNTGHSEGGNMVGLRNMGSRQGRGMAALAFPTKEVLDCLTAFPKPKAQKKSGKRF